MDGAWRAMSNNVKDVKNLQNVKKQPKLRYPFWFGGSASCLAATVTHPLDLGNCFNLENDVTGLY